MAREFPVVFLGTDDEETPLPWVYIVCPDCRGTGVTTRHVEGAGGGITQSEMADILHDDPDFLEDYLGGKYDSECPDCGGIRVVPEVDKERCTPEQWAAWERHLDHEAECWAEARNFARMEGQY